MAELQAPLFTRGGANAPDTRGESMMQRHAFKIQTAKEGAAVLAIKSRFSKLSPAVMLLALEETDWEVEQAAKLLDRFQDVKKAQLADLHTALQRLTKPTTIAEVHSDISDDSDSGQKRKRRAHSRDGKKHKKQKQDKKAKIKKRHKEDKGSGIKAEYGKYGVIREADLANKLSEFALWASEVHKIDLEVLPKNEEKELFRTFCEDYNTATLPHKKYYDLHAYQQKKAAKAAKHGKAEDGEKHNFNDEEELRRTLLAQRAAEQQERLRDAYLDIKHHGKAEEMREQELLRAQMSLAYRTGDQTKAAQIMERLKPDEIKEREAARRLDPEPPN